VALGRLQVPFKSVLAGPDYLREASGWGAGR